ncbi:MAG: hypothetical protein HOL90_04020, partial [Candidatus Nitrosopelagicus sp.]|nr:hypothetical protein [Candidatus Nitrosopelagicus sp.]
MFIIAIVAVAMIGVMVPSVFAQSTDLNLILDPFPITANEGDLIMFSGILLTADGQYVISDALILIKSDVPYGRDQTIASATTDENGEFFTSWIATSDRINYNLYAVFEGDSVIPEVQSERFTFTVISNDDSLCDQKNFNSRINIDSVPSLAYVGETIEFVGTLSDINGCPLINQKIHLVNPHILRPYPDEIISSKDIVFATTTTDSQGMFVIEWDVTHVVNDLIPELHLVFEGGNGSGSTKKSIDLEILRYNSYITLDPIPNSIDVGESVKFSGNLVLEGDSMEGHVVYIKDEDPFNADDLLATAYVNSDGSYSITWIAEKVDSDGVADIYASFEGTPTHYRTTTCDDGKTSDLGGSCLNTISLRTIGVTLEPDPTYQPQPSGYKFNGDEYMKLYYALSFNKNPVIAIVPQPDSYDEVKPYFIPIQEGIITWNSGLEKTGGDWNVDFDIIKPGEKFPQRPDVIINVVAYDNDLDCGYTTGVAWVTGEKPLNSKVCATSFGNPADPDSVSATAGHEFIHTVGLGHAFNKVGDVMCSVENGQPTCPTSFFGKSTIPSDFNLEAVKVMYGKDGWKNPNYIVTYGEKFTVNDFNSEQQIIPTNPINEPENFNDNLIEYALIYYDSNIEMLSVAGPLKSCSDSFGKNVLVTIFDPSGKLISENELSFTTSCWFQGEIPLNSKDLISGEWDVSIKYYDSELKSNFIIYSFDLEPPVAPTPVAPTPVAPT